MEDNRCKRTGTNWRCSKTTLPGKSYCEKHYLYCMSRNTRRKNNNVTVSSPVNVNCISSSAGVEPYRPVIDFETEAPEVLNCGAVGNVGRFVDQSEIMGWLLDDFGGGNGNDHFGLDGIFGCGGNDHVAPDKGDLECRVKTEVCDENQEINCDEKKNVCLGKGVEEGQIGEVGCGENNVNLGKGVERKIEDNVIVMAMEANCGLLVGKKRKRATPFGFDTTKR